MKHGITMRGDSLYCPLSLSIEPYWWCEPDCPHCYFRGLNHVWGKDLRPIALDALDRKLRNGLKNKNPTTPLAHALARKKTIRLGNKTDPFQPLEREYQKSTGAMKILRELDWSFVVQTRFPALLQELGEQYLYQGPLRANYSTILLIISPGGEKDWQLLERKKTDPIPVRLKHLKRWIKKGYAVGVNGEPFIPGFHTVEDFEDTVKQLKAVGVKSYNTYNFHFTPHVAKRLALEVPEVDIEKVWRMNQDRPWKKILVQLLEIAKKHDMVLGCPDFVNSGMEYRETANTCCGIDVPNPCTFNTHYFKRLFQEGKTLEEILEATWDGTGDMKIAKQIVNGEIGCSFYTLRDVR